MKSVMLHVADDAGFSGRLQVALDLVREFDGHLTCLQPVAFEMIFTGEFYGAPSAIVMETAYKRARDHRHEVEAHLAKEDVTWTWVSETSGAQGTLLDNACLHDVAVLSAFGDGETGGRISPLVGGVAIHARTPVLVVPPDCSGIDIDRPALVAWNGSVEAANALRSTVPVLRRASSVYLVAVSETSGSAELGLTTTEAAEYLSLHGVASEVVELPVDANGIAHSLLQAAVIRGAGCIVMGAYGHSRLRETIFGGVTREMLSRTEIPLLMAH